MVGLGPECLLSGRTQECECQAGECQIGEYKVGQCQEARLQGDGRQEAGHQRVDTNSWRLMLRERKYVQSHSSCDVSVRLATACCLSKREGRLPTAIHPYNCGSRWMSI